MGIGQEPPSAVTAKPATVRRPLTVPEPEMTLEEVAAELGVTPACIQQIERKALNKLCRQLTKRGLNPETLF